MCGASAGDPDPFGRTRKTRLMIGHIVDKSKGGSDTLGNLRAMCEACNEGIQNISLPKPGYVQLLTHVRRATLDDQQRLFEWLKVKLSGRTTSKDR
jgi:5-methylcytosine-specific restriction endonuclease McrA